MCTTYNPSSEPHPAIQIVHAYLVERGWIVGHQQVGQKSNEVKALPELIEQLKLKGVVFTFDAINTQKNCEIIVASENHYIAALKDNQPKLLERVRENFQVEEQWEKALLSSR
ncbi:ISAs1 family transposase [Gloeobacter morelensis]|uniref:ISAs1 family transposase n=1 Tax=Gloeobacter morelensis MG652769 TaxID=2781736 RepID=A0ABY3PU17_9CYAN|nr:ISAs1 family transposase [Gloeobacter morelensis]UFP96978.1 ISAs1 family transposase [Gloeobacter morelensis MG652769]